jgi:hypothetical protein
MLDVANELRSDLIRKRVFTFKLDPDNRDFLMCGIVRRLGVNALLSLDM